jgi:hypothetical protein
MGRSKILLRTLIGLVLITSVVATLPAAAQEADWLVSSERGTVGISSPAADDTISGAVVITGTAISPGFSYYKVEYSVDGDTWFPVDGDAYKHETAVTEDTLATWDTTVFKNGAYWLRAVVVDNTGNYVASGLLMVTVNNPKLTVEQLKNAEYQGIYQEPIQLTDGTYEGEPFVEGGASRPTVTFIEPYAFGDLNGDGVDDAVVLLVESSGGSGSFVYMAAVLNQGGKPENVDTVLLGDRAQVQSLTITDSQINVTLVTHGPDDPMCCPTQEAGQTYELQENKLVQTAGEVIGSGE